MQREKVLKIDRPVAQGAAERPGVKGFKGWWIALTVHSEHILKER